MFFTFYSTTLYNSLLINFLLNISMLGNPALLLLLNIRTNINIPYVTKLNSHWNVLHKTGQEIEVNWLVWYAPVVIHLLRDSLNGPIAIKSLYNFTCVGNKFLMYLLSTVCELSVFQLGVEVYCFLSFIFNFIRVTSNIHCLGTAFPQKSIFNLNGSGFYVFYIICTYVLFHR